MSENSQNIKDAGIIPGYKILEKIHESYTYVIYKGSRIEDGLEVIIKSFSTKYPKKEELLGIQREYRIVNQLSIEGVINFYDLISYSNGNLAIVMERFGVSLDKYLLKFENHILPMDQFFSLAIQLAQICGKLHEKRIVHKKLRPSKILYDPLTERVKLIDFGSSSELSREHLETGSLSKWTEISLPYISPEQTGRINRDVDYRSDLYSLGISFYQILTGQLPFSANDPMEWVHCTISREPLLMHTVNQKIPIILSEIIDKLISKNAEDRYQSSYGLISDLKKCKDELKRGTGQISFKLAQSDISRKFQIPQKLYGRKIELDRLKTYFEHVSHGAVEFCLVSGYSGVGKTALVGELGVSIVNKKGYLIQGKFEQFRQNAPYVAIGDAFSNLIRQILEEPKKRLAGWNEKISQALGTNAQLLIDLIPELELIIGKQPLISELSPEEEQNRFSKLFINFVSVFANQAHPLVIFLDDLQWSDVPTLNLINQLVTSSELNHLFIIGAYRDNEVDTTHPLNLTLDEIRNKRIVENLALLPLSLEDTYELTRDTLLCDEKGSQELSKVLYDKTLGNPFFTIELLKNLKERRAIYFNSSKGFWDWDIHAVESENYSDNVIDILVASQSRLNPSTQHVLQLAACIGATFDLRTLSSLEDSTMEKTGAELHDALIFNMVVPLNENYKYVSPNSSKVAEVASDLSNELNPTYKFRHDRIQQAAYSQINEDKRQALHLSIGKLMLLHSPKEEFDDKVMEIVGHLNEGRSLINDANSRLELAKYNLAAGIKANHSSAYDSALDYLKIGHEMLGDSAWEMDYRLSWELYNALQQSFYLTGDWERADIWTNILLNNSKTSIEKGLVLSARTRQYATTQRMQESIKAAYEGLFILGFEFTNNPTTKDIYEEVKLIDDNLDGRPVSSLIDLPEIADQKAKIANQLLMEIFPAAFLSGSGEMFPYLVLKSVNIAIKYGNSIETAFAYVAYGMLLCGHFDNIEQGYEYGKLGVKLSEKLDDLSLKARIIYVYAMFIHHWSNHWSSMTPWFRKGIEAGYQSGDLLYLAYSAQDCIIWDPKLDLETASKEHRKLLDIVKECEYKDSLDSGTLFLQMQLNFQGLTQKIFSLTDDTFDEMKCLEGMHQRHFMTGISNYNIYKAEIHLLYNDPSGALEYVQEQEKRMASVMALPQSVRFHIVSFLVHSMLILSQNSKKQEQYLSKMRESLKKVSRWAKQCYENFEHLRLLMEAEMANYSGGVQEALSFYEQSISHSKKHGFLRDEAMANEFTAKFLLRLGFSKAADGYLQQSHYLYYRWGAHRKVDEMEGFYQYFESSEVHIKNMAYRSNNQYSGTSESKKINTNLLDINSVFKASQTISGELVLEKLLKATLQVLIENAGAQKGFLIEEINGQIVIRAQIPNEEGKSSPVKSVKDDENIPALPMTLINKAIVTNEAIVIDNASKINSFSSDPYIKKVKPFSVICVPLPIHGKRPSAVYLENNLTLGAFTQDRVNVIKLLASQASISLENARIYARQENLLKAQERFVPLQFLKHLGHEDITKAALGDSVSMEMSVLFTDILDFTPLVEQQTPKEVIQFLNRLFNKLGASIKETEGFIDSYSGDQIMGLFAGQASQSIEAGILMSRALEDFNKSSLKNGLPEIRLGIGINTGPLVLGVMGTNDRMQCSVLGDTVNLASRIEQLTRVYDTQFLISEHTYFSLENPDSFSVRMVDYVSVKGKGEAVKLYEVLNAENNERRAAKESTKELLKKGLEAYYNLNFIDALKLFDQALLLSPHDRVVSIFISRAKRYIENPPPVDWEGIENLQQK